MVYRAREHAYWCHSLALNPTPCISPLTPCPVPLPAPAGLSKFLGGMLGAAFSPRLMLAIGLMATSVINIAFGFTSGVAWWTLLWAMNGGIQVGYGGDIQGNSRTS